MRPHYSWTRYWVPAGGIVHSGTDSFPLDPTTEFGRSAASTHRRLEEFEDIRCVLLEGEAGLGKTTALKEAAAALRAEGARVREIDLAEYADESVFRIMFDHEGGEGPFYVFVDSLDESHLPNVSRSLERALRTRAPEQMRLRIACRTGVWPNPLRQALHAQWSDAVDLEIVPLQAKDVRHAAKQQGLDADGFLAAVHDLEAEPLAMKPVTLKLLLDYFEANQRLPESQAELYRTGCLALCRESNPGRLGVGDVGKLGERERLVIAERVAAVSVLAGRGLIAHGGAAGATPANVVSMSDLSGGTEPLDGEKVPVNEAAVREVLDHTGLFTRTSGHLTFFHRTFAEFLAAEYCRTRLSVAQVKSLLMHPDGSGRIAPPLVGVAAWLATMQKELFDHVLATDPSILVGGDAAALPDSTRSRIMAAVLRLHAEGRLAESWDTFPRFQKLRHDGLAVQLSDVFRDASVPQRTRSFALHFARLFELSELAPALIHVAVNRDEPLSLRGQALAAVATVPPDLTQVVAATLDDANGDPRHEIRGQVLRLLWPDGIAGDPFHHLPTSKRNKFGGAYDAFLFTAAKRLRDEHLLQGIEWVENLARDVPFTVRNFAADLFRRASERLDDPAIRNCLASCIWKRATAYEPLFGDYYDKEVPLNEDARRRVLLELLDGFLSIEKGATTLAFSHPPMLLGSDLPWLVESLESARPEQRKRLAECIRALVLGGQDADGISLIVETGARFPEVRAQLSDWFDPILLGSEQARFLKEEHERRLELLRDEGPAAKPLDPPPATRVERNLAAAEGGDIDQWCNLVANLSLEETSTEYWEWSEDNLEQLPGWKGATEETRARILEAARRYVLRGDPLNDTWLGTDHYKTAAVDGYKALRLLYQLDQPWVVSLGPETWAKWSPIVIAFPKFREWPDRSKVTQLAHRGASAVTARAIAFVSRQDDRRHGQILDLGESSDTWGPDMVREVVGLINDAGLKPASTTTALQAALSHGVGEALDVALRFIAERNVEAPATAKERAAAAALALLLEQTRAFWPTFSTLLATDRGFCRDLLLTFAQHIGYGHSEDIAGRLDADQLAELHIWLSREFPRAEDPVHHGAHEVGPRESIADFRDGLIGALRRLVDPSALIAIRSIRAALPHEYLVYAELEIEQTILEKTWIPPTPRGILELARSSELRLVESPLQLLEFVLESLARLNERLQGALPEARFLWNDCPDGKKPKDEGDFADYVAARLQDDLSRRGIVFNREVQIRRKAGPETPGERTDIFVTAVPNVGSPAASPLTVIVEAKGSWNADLDTAMKSQLRDRYLHENQTKHGIYLVGRFASPGWSHSDSRRRVHVEEAASMRARLAAQAVELSTEGVVLRAVVIEAAFR